MVQANIDQNTALNLELPQRIVGHRAGAGADFCGLLRAAADIANLIFFCGPQKSRNLSVSHHPQSPAITASTDVANLISRCGGCGR